MEKYTLSNMKRHLVNFYPRWAEYTVLENQGKIRDIPKSAKIEDYGVVIAQDGTEVNMRELRTEMESAKTAIVSQSPLFAPYVHNFTPIYTWLIPTMATDGIRLFVNPLFADKLSWHQKIFVLIHEIMHCVLLHMERLKGRDPKVFNVAGDFEINDLIVDTIDSFDAKFVEEMGGLYDEQYLNWNVEKIYEEVKKNMPPMPPNQNAQGNQGSNQGGEPQDCQDCGGTGKIQPGKPGDPQSGGGKGEDDGQEGGQEPGEGGGQPGDTCPTCGGSGKQPGQPGEIGGAGAGGSGSIYERMGEYDPAGTGGVIPEEMGKKIAEESGYKGDELGPDVSAKDKWNVDSGKMMDDLEKGVQGSKGAGSGKGNKLLKTLQQLHKGDVNWKRLFRKYVATALSPEKQWRLGSKKHLQKPYLKRAEKQKFDAIKKIVILVDTSGSMYSNPKTIPRILNEVNQIIFAKKVKKIYLAFFDSSVLKNDVEIIQNKGKNTKKPVVKSAPVGGGTMFQPALDWVDEELKGNVSLVVFVTDGYNSDEFSKPRWGNKVIWLIYDNPGWKNPWGKMINLSGT